LADDPWFRRRFEPLKWLALVALAGALLGVASYFVGSESIGEPLGVVAIVLIAPVFIYCFIVPIWHWKERYVGTHGDLWGVLLLVEVSSWLKVVYWFRHILADWKGSGRYRKAPESPDA